MYNTLIGISSLKCVIMFLHVHFYIVQIPQQLRPIKSRLRLFNTFLMALSLVIFNQPFVSKCFNYFSFIALL